MAPTAPGSAPVVVVVGDDELVSATARELEAAGARVACVAAARADAVLPEALTGAGAAVIVTRQDALALRLVLLVTDRRPGLRLVVTVFDRTLGEELRGGDLGCIVVSSAELVAAAIAGPCADAGVDALRRTGNGLDALSCTEDEVRHRPYRPRAIGRGHRVLDAVVGLLHPFDTSAQVLLAGVAGLAAMLLVEVVIGMASLHETFVDSILLGARTLATVSSNDAVNRASDLVKVLSVLTITGAIASLALFSAGLVSRIVEPRHLGILGRRSLPRRDHVVIVGMGQIGLRTAVLLREAGVSVIGVDRDPDAIGVRLGAVYGLPIVIASGEDRGLLRRLGAERARCVAAVTSDDLANVAIALAARAIRPDTRIVLRAGDGEIARETRSLLHLGLVRDAHRLVAIGLASAALGTSPAIVLTGEDSAAWVVDEAGSTARWTRPAPDA